MTGSVRDKYGIPAEGKIVMFTPVFRGGKQKASICGCTDIEFRVAGR